MKAKDIRRNDWVDAETLIEQFNSRNLSPVQLKVLKIIKGINRESFEKFRQDVETLQEDSRENYVVGFFDELCSEISKEIGLKRIDKNFVWDVLDYLVTTVIDDEHSISKLYKTYCIKEVCPKY